MTIHIILLRLENIDSRISLVSTKVVEYAVPLGLKGNIQVVDFVYQINNPIPSLNIDTI